MKRKQKKQKKDRQKPKSLVGEITEKMNRKKRAKIGAALIRQGKSTPEAEMEKERKVRAALKLGTKKKSMGSMTVKVVKPKDKGEGE